jgi:imidazolonepropionase-like amidohydrolase
MTRTVFRGGRVFDGTGSDPAKADVVVEDGRIVDVATGLDGDEAVDMAGRTLLPGLFDCHVHVTMGPVDLWRSANTPFSYPFYEAARNLRATLACGITSIRDAGGADLGIQQALADGLIDGPRMQLSLTLISQTGGHNDPWLVSGDRVPLIRAHPGIPSGIVDGPDEMRRKVRELHRMGANVIKVATSGGVLSARDVRASRSSGRWSSRCWSRRPRPPGCSSWPTPRRPTGSRTRSVPASAPSSTGSTSTTRGST